jgi:hypothetical protein
MTMSRRAALALPALLLVPAAPALAEPGSVRFRVVREGTRIGSHVVTVTQQGARRTARTEVDIVVRFAGITVFRYLHRFEEVWEGPRLIAVASRLEKNGETSQMQARAEGGLIQGQGPEGAVRLPADAAPLSWWDPATLQRPLFSAITGKPLAARAARQADAGGGFRIRLAGEAEGEATYDGHGGWIAHAMKGEDGSSVAYERA